MRFACSLGPAQAGQASCVSSSTKAASAAPRAQHELTCASFVLTFMALVNSQDCPMRAPDYTVCATPPRMSQPSDVASRRQFEWLLCRTAQCAANCEPG